MSTSWFTTDRRIHMPPFVCRSATGICFLRLFRYQFENSMPSKNSKVICAVLLQTNYLKLRGHIGTAKEIGK